GRARQLSCDVIEGRPFVVSRTCEVARERGGNAFLDPTQVDHGLAPTLLLGEREAGRGTYRSVIATSAQRVRCRVGSGAVRLDLAAVSECPPISPDDRQRDHRQ